MTSLTASFSLALACALLTTIPLWLDRRPSRFAVVLASLSGAVAGASGIVLAAVTFVSKGAP